MLLRLLLTIIMQIISAHNFSCSLDHVMLVGKLLHVNSELCQQLIRYHGNELYMKLLLITVYS